MAAILRRMASKRQPRGAVCVRLPAVCNAAKRQTSKSLSKHINVFLLKVMFDALDVLGKRLCSDSFGGSSRARFRSNLSSWKTSKLGR